MSTPLAFSPVLNHIITAFPSDIPIYLVGGAVRDLLLARLVHDYDFVLADDLGRPDSVTFNQLFNFLAEHFVRRPGLRQLLCPSWPRLLELAFPCSLRS